MHRRILVRLNGSELVKQVLAYLRILGKESGARTELFACLTICLRALQTQLMACIQTRSRSAYAFDRLTANGDM